MTDMIAIDADGHVHESEEYYDSYLDAAYRDRVSIGLDENQNRRFFFDGQAHPPFPKSISIRKPMTPENRLKVLDKERIRTAVLFPSGVMTAPYAADTDLAQAMIRAYNDWMRDFCATAPGRLAYAAPLAIQNPDWAAAEARRAVDMGAVAVTIRPNPVLGRTLDNPVYDPLYQAVQELDVPLIIHETTGDPNTAGGDRYGMMNTESYVFNHIISHPFEQMFAAMSLVAGGVLERFPRLRVGFFEAGCSWVPYWLARLDDHFAHAKLGPDLPIKMKPSEYFERQCIVSCDPGDHTTPLAVQALGAHKILFATDYPHFDSGAGAVGEFLEVGGISEAQQRAILWDNAVAFYGLEG